MGVFRTASNNLTDRLAAHLTEVAYPVALRHGVQGFSVDVELDIWKAIHQALHELSNLVSARTTPTRRLWEDVLARSTEAAYQVALRRGFRGTFVDLEVGLWDAFHA